jgi:light-regulated signal transduction histidine kinase (bacteriophytochrome)
MVGVSMDYTDKKMESVSMEGQVNLRTAELLKTNKQLKAANEQLEQFAFISSHDLQEPLRKIATFSDLLSHPDAALNEYARKYSDKINASATRMSALVKDLLTFSVLVNSGDRKLVPVNLSDLVNQVIIDFELTIEQKKAVITIFDLPVIQAVPVQISRLFHNLISNALKFSVSRPMITITSKSALAEDFSKHPELLKNRKYVSISINDNGIGFDEKYTEKMFILFQRLNELKGVAGSGVGLAICKKIVEDHAGFIFASSEKNVGSTFVIYLPE